MKKRVIVQVFAGGYRGGQVDFARVRNALERLPQGMALAGVVMGWAQGAALNREARAYLGGRGIPLYLWLPVFAETGILAADVDPLLDAEGRAIKDGSDGPESFEFCCPASARNADRVREVFLRHFDGIGFDGVFLDKIRFPSLANAGGWLCFCERCREVHRRRGLPDGETPNGADGRLLRGRADIVTGAVGGLCDWFRARGYSVGLDVFAPFLSPLVGQDIAALSRRADWIKPMMYMHTHAPAGLPFELDALRRACPDAPLPCGMPDCMGDEMFLRRDLSRAMESAACPIHPGIELNRVPGIADVRPDDVRRSLAMLPDGIETVVLSWDLLRMPPENLQAAAELLG